MRQDDTHVMEAMREALANSLLHADYYGTRGIVIEKGRTYFKFSNPGTLRISMEEALKGGVSDPRNPNIFKIFSLIGIGERQGFGLDNIRNAWKEQNWRNPELIEEYQPERTILNLRTVSLLPEESLNMLKEVLKDTYNELSRDEVMALVTAHQEGQVTNSRLQILCEKSSIELNKVLNGLVLKHLLTAAGQGRGTVYYLSKIFRNGEMNSEVCENNFEVCMMNSEGCKSNSEVYTMNSEGCENETELKLKEISKPAREKKKINSNIMKQIIIKMCSIRPMSIKELSRLLNRSDDGIRIEYITPLIEEGKIRPLYEGQKNHPKQAYETVKQK